MFVRALLGFEQRRGWALGVRGRAGAVTAIQRCGSALNVNPHFHTLVAEGVFAEQRDGSQRFVPLCEPPTDIEVARLLAAVRWRILRLLRRHDIDLERRLDDERSDPLALDSDLGRPTTRVGRAGAGEVIVLVGVTVGVDVAVVVAGAADIAW